MSFQLGTRNLLAAGGPFGIGGALQAGKQVWTREDESELLLLETGNMWSDLEGVCNRGILAQFLEI